MSRPCPQKARRRVEAHTAKARDRAEMTAILVAALAYVVPTSPLGYSWHLTVFKDSYESLQVYRKQVVPLLGLSSMCDPGRCLRMYLRRRHPAHDRRMAHEGSDLRCVWRVFSWSFTPVAAAAKSPITSIRDFFALETAFTALQWIIVGLINRAVFAVTGRSREWKSSKSSAQGRCTARPGARLAV